MEQSTHLGMNKTGIDMSPIQSKKMVDAAESTPPDLTDGRETFVSLKQHYLENTDPLGSVPLPGTLKGVLKSTVKMVTGHHPEVFINKLGERLAYERSGVRVYEQLILKCRHAAKSNLAEFNIPIEQLEEFRAQELQHFELLIHCFNKLGADPTAQTPDADAVSVGASGLMKVIMDPRTSLSQSLQAVLAIEMADNAAWELLAKLADDMGLPDMVQQFEHALRQENNHLEHVRRWYEESIRGQATMNLSH